MNQLNKVLETWSQLKKEKNLSYPSVPSPEVARVMEVKRVAETNDSPNLRHALNATEEAANTPVVNEYGFEPNDPNHSAPVTPKQIFARMKSDRQILIAAGKVKVADVPPDFAEYPDLERDTPAEIPKHKQKQDVKPSNVRKYKGKSSLRERLKRNWYAQAGWKYRKGKRTSPVIIFGYNSCKR